MPLKHSPEGHEPTFSRRLLLKGIVYGTSAYAAKQIISPVRTALADTTKGIELVSNKTVISGNPKRTLVDVAQPFPGFKWIGKLSGNGGREVLIYVPVDTNPLLPMEVIYHFHGTHSQLINEKQPELLDTNQGYKSGVGKFTVGANRLRQVMRTAHRIPKASDRNIVVVYPLSAGARGRKNGIPYKNGYDAQWMHTKKTKGKDDMQRLHDEVLEIMNEHVVAGPKIEKITLKGHSAGGLTIMNAAVSGFPADRIDYLDATYPGWTNPGCEAAIRNNPDVEINAFVRPSTDTDRPARNIESFKNVRIIWTKKPHGKMIENFFEWERK